MYQASDDCISFFVVVISGVCITDNSFVDEETLKIFLSKSTKVLDQIEEDDTLGTSHLSHILAP